MSNLRVVYSFTIIQFIYLFKGFANNDQPMKFKNIFKILYALGWNIYFDNIVCELWWQFVVVFNDLIAYSSILL